jgi:hypothetical protein
MAGLDDQTIDQVLKWWARQPRKLQLRCIAKESMAELIKAAARVKAMEEEGQAKRYDRDLDSLAEAEEIRLDKIRQGQKRASPKARKVWNYRELIKRLLGKNASWAEIAVYLETYHKFKINSSYLRRCWNELKKANLV